MSDTYCQLHKEPLNNFEYEPTRKSQERKSIEPKPLRLLTEFTKIEQEAGRLTKWLAFKNLL
ncbi:MAG TPA: hypothetical protein DSN98_03610 [Thermoplasmata archaeon]|nr:MAG TPA: hypothetical protein DSN98_03610 [Thermoplasmata archaeon]